jgi:hypothetical protein
MERTWTNEADLKSQLRELSDAQLESAKELAGSLRKREQRERYFASKVATSPLPGTTADVKADFTDDKALFAACHRGYLATAGFADGFKLVQSLTHEDIRRIRIAAIAIAQWRAEVGQKGSEDPSLVQMLRKSDLAKMAVEKHPSAPIPVPQDQPLPISWDPYRVTPRPKPTLNDRIEGCTIMFGLLFAAGLLVFLIGYGLVAAVMRLFEWISGAQ